MSSIKNVAIAGASGNVGSLIFKKFSEAKGFNLTVLKRAGSSSVFPEGTKVVEVDYSSIDSLKSALQGQDVLISTLATTAVDTQTKLIDAAIAAGVKRLIPSEFGSNLDNPNVRKLPVFGQKVAVQDYIIEKSKSTPVTYTFVYTGAFLDWGLENNFTLDISGSKPTIIDGGDLEFSSTTLSSIADAVYGVVSHPEETKNRAVYIHDAVITQNKLLALAKKAAPERPWETVDVKLDDLTAKADERLAKQLYDAETFVPYIYRALFDPKSGGKYVKTDNELLGVKGKTDEDIVEIIKSLIK